MREITCGDGMRWKILLVAESGGAAPDADVRDAARHAADQEDDAVILLHCSTCEGEERHVTIRSPHHDWLTMSSGTLCELILEAQEHGTASA